METEDHGFGIYSHAMEVGDKIPVGVHQSIQIKGYKPYRPKVSEEGAYTYVGKGLLIRESDGHTIDLMGEEA